MSPGWQSGAKLHVTVLFLWGMLWRRRQCIQLSLQVMTSAAIFLHNDIANYITNLVSTKVENLCLSFIDLSPLRNFCHAKEKLLMWKEEW